MIKCSKENCGFENPDGSKFCCACGAKLDIKSCCSNCGAELILGAKFCTNCGMQVDGASETSKNCNGKNKLIPAQIEQQLPRAHGGLYEYFDRFRGIIPELREAPLDWKKTDDEEWVVTQKCGAWCQYERYGKEGYLGNYKIAEQGYHRWLSRPGGKHAEYTGEVFHRWDPTWYDEEYTFTVDKFAYDGDYVDCLPEIDENHKGKISGIIDACKSLTIFSLIDNDNIVGAKEYIMRNPSVVSSENPISPLLAATMTGSVAMAKIFIDAGADVNSSSSEFYRKTPLIIATSQGDSVMAKFLLDNGAMAFLPDVDGNTPLHYAAENDKYIACLKLLLQLSGVDKNMKNNEGKTALDIALGKKAEAMQCIKLLEKNK